MQKDAEKGSRLLGLVVSRSRNCLTLPSAPPLREKKKKKNPVGDGGSCAAARSLWLWDNRWEFRKCKNWIYSCRWRRSWGRQGRVSRAQASGEYKAFFDYVIRLPSTEQPDLVKVLWIGFVTVCTLSEGLWLNGQVKPSTTFALALHQCGGGYISVTYLLICDIICSIHLRLRNSSLPTWVITASFLKKKCLLSIIISAQSELTPGSKWQSPRAPAFCVWIFV